MNIKASVMIFATKTLIPNLDKMIRIEGERYEYEMNMLYEFDSESIMQVPIETIYIENNETSHFNALKDSVKIYKSILKFSASSYLSFLVDYFTFLLLVYKLDVLKALSPVCVSLMYFDELE